MSSLWQQVKAEILYQVNQLRPFIALAGTQTDGRLTIRRVTEATARSEQYARLAGFDVAVGDEIVCLIIGGKPLVLGKLQRTTPVNLSLIQPLEIHANDDSSFGVTDGLGTALTNARLAVDVVNFAGKGALNLANGMRLRGYSDGFSTLKFEVDNADGSVLSAGAINHDGTTVGLFGVTPAARPAAYTATNVTTDRTYDSNATSTAELANVLGTLLADLKTLGIVQ